MDTQAFLGGLDSLFARKAHSSEVEAYLSSALDQAHTNNDWAAELTVLNEVMGFYRSQSRHAEAMAAGDEALALIRAHGLERSEAGTTTLINAATAHRAALDYPAAIALYRTALSDSERTLGPTNRKLAALHNNLSMVYSDTEDYTHAYSELQTALTILTQASANPTEDIDIGSTHANMALVSWRLGEEASAARHTSAAMAIFAAGHHEDASHFSSALAAAGETFFRMGRLEDSRAAYTRALSLIAASYGTDNDAYAITSSNLAEVEEALAAGDHLAQSTQPDVSGLELARRYWEEYGRPLLADKYERVRSRIAIGLVGHGSECYGFDDATSRDHDFAPRFCLWVADDDFADFGEDLQRDYEALPDTFLGYSRTATPRTPRSRGSQRREGVLRIPQFYENLTGFATPPTDSPSEAVQWLLLEEAGLAAATNGEIFADALGAFSSTRRAFKAMPDDVRLSLISRRIGMMAQAGQYNFPRMVARGQHDGAWRSLTEFIHASASLVFLVNTPSSAGYLPYYKWEMAALERLCSRMGTHMADSYEPLLGIMTAASEASFGDTTSPAFLSATDQIATVCSMVVTELRTEGLTTSSEDFLEWHRPYVEEAIANPQLRSLGRQQ